MLQTPMDPSVGPNISNDSGNFFQSDRDIELERTRQLKKAQSSGKNAAGQPIAMPSKVLSFALVKNGTTQAYVAESGHVARKIDLKTGTSLNVFKGHTGPVTSVAVGYDEQDEDVFIVTGSWDKTIRKWDTKTATTILTFNGHSDFVKRIVIFGNRLYSASSDSTIRQWDLETGECLRVFKEHTRAVEDIVLTEDGRILFSASSDTTIKKWDTTTGQVLATLSGHLTSVYALVLQEGSLWSASADKTAKRWDLETNLPDSSFEHPDFVRSLAVFPGGAHLATGSRDENVRLWDVASEKCVRTLSGHYGEVSDIKRQGSTLWSASLDGTIRSWSITEQDFKGGPEPIVEDIPIEPVKLQKKSSKSVKLTDEEERELAELMGSDDDL
ncbi:uncharacterized protein SPPG_03538 [Spizellomyces punctatus DAOM BR117]|uniref:Uncharacterized protein n=1 Tax=Spizellomyces punctatus (strain DAOM BR117) TaxID=645134 RepID=A0A0L0HLG8_SPIPD|nr:uncharacterized protein SPPG_03538 [Spizellomyces punctatus DAOM BR117]KND01745.1 hypothetical protein SPPG_03538 [Spizellomyces punctatus DAOM BR117]|eukprot:XP_016609784.1 hypothetical protein SPPG_03538 [Spizellomyces punctatus DAOM BR117]